MGLFERDTAVQPDGELAFTCSIEPDWWVVAGPNGGYLAAVLTRALMAVEGDRPPRSLTVQYLRAPKEGPARVEVTRERVGRSVSFLSARLIQEDRPCALALAVLALDRDEALRFDRSDPPRAPQPENLDPAPRREELPPFAQQFDYRPAVGPRLFSGADEALTGGWLRLVEERPLDAALVVALTDSWPPAVFTASTTPLAVPTLDLTVHLRGTLPRPSDWVLGRFRTRVARSGFLEEDGELWSRDGELLAQSRQLALAL
jgi:acyl-CoA thioesterase